VSRIAEAFADGPAFIPYLAAGDPSAAASRRYVEALVDGGADLVELGLPFSDPVADGATIQGAVRRALEAGMTPERYFEFVADLDVDVPLVCMTYYNLIYQYGTEPGPDAFVERAAAVGIDGFVVPDLPAEEAGPLRAACDRHDRDLVFIVAPTTRGERLEQMMAQVSGYVYVQARLGTSGARGDVSDQTAASLARLADYDVPKAVGFGISERAHAREIVAAGADGIIVGSALVEIIAEGVEEDRSVEAVAATLEETAADLVAGVTEGQDLAKPEGT
jgi:tryptophan synthase alpha chain